MKKKILTVMAVILLVPIFASCNKPQTSSEITVSEIPSIKTIETEQFATVKVSESGETIEYLKDIPSDFVIFNDRTYKEIIDYVVSDLDIEDINKESIYKFSALLFKNEEYIRSLSKDEITMRLQLAIYLGDNVGRLSNYPTVLVLDESKPDTFEFSIMRDIDKEVEYYKENNIAFNEEVLRAQGVNSIFTWNATDRTGFLVRDEYTEKIHTDEKLFDTIGEVVDRALIIPQQELESVTAKDE